MAKEFFNMGYRVFVIGTFENDINNQHITIYNKNITNAIEENNYNLQYLLYSVALNLYLGKTISDYKYENNFGGVYYLFVRGISGGSKKEGVFFNRPEQKVVEALTKYLTGVEYGQ